MAREHPPAIDVAPARQPGANASLMAGLLDHLNCGAALIDRAGVIAQVNARLCAMVQRAATEMVGRRLIDLSSNADGRALIQRNLDQFEQPFEQELLLSRPDGTTVPIIAGGRYVAGEGGGHRLITLVDVSSLKTAERDLQQRYHDVATLSDTVLEQALQLKHYSQELERRVQERTAELRTANMESIYMLAVASEAKDVDTGAHVRRIESYTRLLAREMALSVAEADRLGYSSILHDVGKIHVPDDILRKSGPLSAEEWIVMRQHTLVGERILSREPFFEVARHIARSHHENWDGSGYPDGAAGEAIPLAARIVRVADVFDALTSSRPYKHAWSPEEAAAHIRDSQGRAFDPIVVRAFANLFEGGRLLPVRATAG